MECNCGEKATIRGVYCGKCYTAMKQFQREHMPIYIKVFKEARK